MDCYSNYLRDKINDHIHGGPDFARPTTTYFALMISMPSASTGGMEVSGGSYARVAVTNNPANWPPSSGQTKTNALIINWGTATANWGTIVAVVEYDAPTAGNMLTFAPLTTPVLVNAGQPFQIPANGGVFNWAV